MTAIVAYWLLYIMQREQRPQRTSPSPLPRHRAVWARRLCRRL